MEQKCGTCSNIDGVYIPDKISWSEFSCIEFSRLQSVGESPLNLFGLKMSTTLNDVCLFSCVEILLSDGEGGSMIVDAKFKSSVKVQRSMCE